jgi:hypothetical protein
MLTFNMIRIRNRIRKISFPFHPVLRIHDILGWIRIWIRGSMPLTNGSGSGTFKMPAKNSFFYTIFSTYYFLKLHLHHFSKMKTQKESQNSRNQGYSYYFCLMIEGSGSGSRAGSGSGSIPLASGSGSWRPKNMWIRIRIRIWIRNTGSINCIGNPNIFQNVLFEHLHLTLEKISNMTCVPEKLTQN